MSSTTYTDRAVSQPLLNESLARPVLANHLGMLLVWPGAHICRWLIAIQRDEAQKLASRPGPQPQ